MKTSTRNQQIDEILKDLRSFPKTTENEYAVEKNIEFFEATRSVFKYILWLIIKAPKIDGSRLLELSDFPGSRWDKELLTRLTEMEKKDYPGMITPLRNAIVKYIVSGKPRLILDFGCGSMEVERQIIEKLIEIRYTEKILFVGIDLSLESRNIAKNNLSALQHCTRIIEMNHINQSYINEQLVSTQKQFTIILASNDVFSLGDTFGDKYFDTILYSKFRHHLTQAQKDGLDVLTTKIAKNVFEYDDLNYWFNLVPPSIGAWKYPVLLNGAIFSRLRDPRKKYLKDNLPNNWRLEYFKIGSYLRIYAD